jgi:hypothetical protein
MTDDVPTTPVAPTVLSTEERTRLAQAYQAEASHLPDLLDANLRALTGELFLIIGELGNRVRKQFAADDDDTKNGKSATVLQLYLKAVQQTHRLAQHERRPAAPLPDASPSATADGSA